MIDVRVAPPSSACTGWPTALPQRSQSAISTALSAWMTMPRRPFIAVPMIDLPPQLADLEGIGADQHVPDRQAHRVGARRLDAGLGHPGIGVAFADAADAAIGVDDDHETVLRGGCEGDVEVGRQEDMAFDVGDLQARRC